MNGAALFDWDGVVVDTSRLHERSWELLAGRHRLALPDDHFLKGFGMRNEQIIPGLLAWTVDPGQVARLSREKEEIFRDLVRVEGVVALPGVEAWIRVLGEAGVPRMIASSTQRANIECILDLLGRSFQFEGMVTAEDVQKGKPDPEVFILAAARAGATPGACVVFEDAHVGIQAARAAGMRVVAVATTHRADALGAADRVVARLDHLSVGDWFPHPAAAARTVGVPR